MITKVGFESKAEIKTVKTERVSNGYAAQILLNSTPNDKVHINNANNVISFSGKNFEYRQNDNIINLISFTGLQDPFERLPIGIQMRVTGVTKNQTNMSDEDIIAKGHRDKKGTLIVNDKPVSETINKLAQSAWVDGQPLNFYQSNDENKPKIVLIDPRFGEVGRVPDEFSIELFSLLENPKIEKDMRFQLSNVIAGTTKGAATIGLRVNLIYTGTKPSTRRLVQNAFDKILNNPECIKKAMLYQQKTTPDEILALILSHETKLNGPESAKKMSLAINKIIETLEDPQNKKILLVGHCKPDGDTIGCILALKNALSLKYPDKQIDCSVDDKVPGLFRHKLPGIDGHVKRPVSESALEIIANDIEQIKAQPQNDTTRTEIEILEEEKQLIQDPANLLDPNEKYNVVMMMDIPTPERFSGAFKRYLVDEDNKPLKDVKCIYVDHHPHRLNEWEAKQSENGIDMQKIHDNNLSWVADAVPAATQLVTIIASKMIPELNSIGTRKEGKAPAAEVFKQQDQQDKLKAFAAAAITGMSTDTGSFLRTSNLLPEEMLLPVSQRPNFMPEGMAKWLTDLTDGIKGKIDKKWLREEISYDLDDTKIPELPMTARETMVHYSVQEKSIPADKDLGIIGLGFVQVDYDQMFKVWDEARNADKKEGEPETTLLDVQNSFKLGEVMSTLHSDPKLRGHSGNPNASPLEKAAREDYRSEFDDDRVAVFICQDKKAGYLDEKLHIATQNGLRLSFRSQEGTIHAELLANLFGGGGHPGASGGRIDLPGIDFDTKLGVEINGVKVTNTKEILAQLKHNHQIMNDNTKTDVQKMKECKKVKVVMDDSGKSCSGLITDVITEIRKENIAEEGQSTKHYSKNFTDRSSNVYSTKRRTGRR